MRGLSRPWLIRLLGAAGLVALAVIVPLKLWRAGGANRLHAMQTELGNIQRTNAATALDNAKLRREVDRLSNDLDAVGRVARDDLGMVKPGEIIFQVEHK
jgi:cell division protein FtsB